MKSELEKHPLLLRTVQQYWERRHMGDVGYCHFLLGMAITAYVLGEPELESEISMLEAVFALKAWHADELMQAAA